MADSCFVWKQSEEHPNGRKSRCEEGDVEKNHTLSRDMLRKFLCFIREKGNRGGGVVVPERVTSSGSWGCIELQ